MNPRPRPLALATTLALAALPLLLGQTARAPDAASCAVPAEVLPAQPAAWAFPWRVRCDAAEARVSGAAALLLGRPLDVNAASARALRAIPGVSRGLAHAIVDERTRGGPFVDAADLQRVPGIAARRAERLAGHLSFGAARP